VARRCSAPISREVKAGEPKAGAHLPVALASKGAREVRAVDEDNSKKIDYGFVGKDEDFSKWVESETFFREGAQALLKSIEDSIGTALSEVNDKFLESEDKKFLESAKENLRSDFDEIVKCFAISSSTGNPGLEEYRYEALWSFMSAMFIAGSRGIVSKSIQNYFKSEHTKRANEAKRADGDLIQPIVERHAIALWNKKASFRENKEGTAKEIAQKVMSDVAKAFEQSSRNPPIGWESYGVVGESADKKAVGRIARRLKRFREKSMNDNGRQN
jgi:hypothetical protein